MAKGDMCEVCGDSNGRIIDSPKFGMILCLRHWSQMDKIGRILKDTECRINEIHVQGNVARIILYDVNGEESGATIIDSDDVGKICNYRWYLQQTGYVVSNIHGKLTLLHRFIMNYTDNKTVDHINHNTLDNRKCNLRVCNKSQNAQNSKIPINNTSGIKGVSRNKKNKYKCWRAYITINQNRIELGNFYTIEEAIATRKEAEKKYFGEFVYKGDVI